MSAEDSKTVEVTATTFDELVLKSDKPVVVDFWAEWCAPCKQLAPALEAVASDMEGAVTIAKLDVDDNASVAAEYSIRGLPTLMLFKDGQVVASQPGVMTKARLEAWIQSNS